MPKIRSVKYHEGNLKITISSIVCLEKILKNKLKIKDLEILTPKKTLPTNSKL